MYDFSDNGNSPPILTLSVEAFSIGEGKDGHRAGGSSYLAGRFVVEKEIHIA